MDVSASTKGQRGSPTRERLEREWISLFPGAAERRISLEETAVRHFSMSLLNSALACLMDGPFLPVGSHRWRREAILRPYQEYWVTKRWFGLGKGGRVLDLDFGRVSYSSVADALDLPDSLAGYEIPCVYHYMEHRPKTLVRDRYGRLEISGRMSRKCLGIVPRVTQDPAVVEDLAKGLEMRRLYTGQLLWLGGTLGMGLSEVLKEASYHLWPSSSLWRRVNMPILPRVKKT